MVRCPKPALCRQNCFPCFLSLGTGARQGQAARHELSRQLGQRHSLQMTAHATWVWGRGGSEEGPFGPQGAGTSLGHALVACFCVARGQPLRLCRASLLCNLSKGRLFCKGISKKH